MYFDFEMQLERTALKDGTTHDFTAALLESDDVLYNIHINNQTLADLSTDQELAEHLLRQNLTNFSVNLVRLIDDMIYGYSQDKESYDNKIQEAVEFDYSAIDEFEEGGNKVPLML